MKKQLDAFIVQSIFLLVACHVALGGSNAGNSPQDIRRKIICDMFEKTVAAAYEMGLSKEETAALFAHVASTAEYVNSVLRLSRTSIDLGEISSTQISDATIEIENISRAPVTMKVRTSCGCTQCRIEAEQLPPGKKTTMTITFNPAEKGGQGEVIEQIALLYGQGNMDRKTLIPVTARIRQYFRVTPTEVNFGDIYRNSGYSAIIDIECSDPEWARQVTVKPPIAFDASVVRSEPGSGNGVRVEVRKNAHYVSGKYASDVVVTTELREQPNTIHVPIYGRVWDTIIRCEPATAEVGFIGADETRNLVCTLTSLDESPFVVENVSTDLGEIRWSLRDDATKRGPERSHCVQLELKATAQKQHIVRGSVWFDIRRGEEQERATLEVRGYYHEALSPG